MRTLDLDDAALSEPDGLVPRPDASADAVRTPEEEVTLLELLDRVLDKGVVLAGDITLSVADVDLVHVGLRVLLTSVERAAGRGGPLDRDGKHPAQASR